MKIPVCGVLVLLICVACGTSSDPDRQEGPPPEGAPRDARPTDGDHEIAKSEEGERRRGLYPEIGPERTGHLKVSEIHEIYWEVAGNPEGIPVFVLGDSRKRVTSLHHTDTLFERVPLTPAVQLITEATE